jgi:hypothetical protein
MRISGWWASRRQRKLEAYDKNHAYATAEEQQQLKRRSLFRRSLDSSITGGMPEGTGISPGGAPIDFTADEKPPRY